ncbi:MAG: alanine racemase [Nitrospinae bacterium]|nr:alanine racemase [Nitrospinota bacterium]
MSSRHPTVAEIDLGAFCHNLDLVHRSIPPGVKVAAMVKADGYGHGALPLIRASLQAGLAEIFGVAHVDEAVELREAGLEAPIIVLGGFFEDRVEEVVAYGLELALYSMKHAEALASEARRQARIVACHLKLDTGMGRLGLPPERALEEAKRLSDLKGVKLAGIMTHFATADHADKAYTSEQLARFERAVHSVRDAGLEVPCVHAANSAAILSLPESHYDMVRPGIMLYGAPPSAEVGADADLRPVMTLKTQVGHLFDLAVGESVSYGRRYVADKASRIATLPIGYADGWSRLLSNRGSALVGDRRVPIVGTVCMDLTMVDVTEVPGVSVGDEVVLIGRQGDALITADEVAAASETISYEVFTRIGKRVPRLYVRDGRPLEVVP